MAKILLIDGSNYLFRAFHALPPLTTSRGEPTGAIKGFHGMLGTVISMVKPDFIACVFDAPGKNFRHEIYPEYKANRPPMPPELKSQIEPIQSMVRLMGIPLISIPGVEADDVLASYARRAESLGWDAVIATGDKDLAQLVDEKIHLINTMTRVVLDREGVFAKYGVYPERIIDYLALMGDKVDNVPGINKCGPKTAAKWIAQYGSLAGVVENAASVTGKIGEYLREGIPFLDAAVKLVTINCEVALPQEPETLVQTAGNEEELARFFDRWEIRHAKSRTSSVKTEKTLPEQPAQADLFSLMPSEGAAAPAPVKKGEISLAVTEEQLRSLAEKLAQAKQNAVAPAVMLFTQGQHFMTDTAVGIAVAVRAGDTVYIPLSHQAGTNADVALFARTLGPWFASDAPKVFHDAKYAKHVFANMGLSVGGAEDALLMSYVHESHLKHDMASLARRYLVLALPDEESLLGKGASRKKPGEIEAADAAAFLGARAEALHAAAASLMVRLANDPALGDVYRKIELKVTEVLGVMERTGVLIDSQLLARQSEALASQVRVLEEKAYQAAGEKLNLASPKQLSEVLFGKLGYPPPKGKKLASGAYSTGEEVLAELALDYPLAAIVLEYRRLTKLMSTYTDKLPTMVYAGDGRVHTTFGQATAVTGRLASSDPNLQNIPVRTEEGRRVREAFVAPEGYKILSADYSQIELRIMAHISDDPGLIRAFREGLDVHRATAAEVFGTEVASVTPDQRRMAKVINFGLIYGMSAWGLKQNLGVEKNVAERYIEQYFARYPKVHQYMENTRRMAHEKGFVETAFGRRLWLPDIASARQPVRAAAERAAINAPMQGTAADLIKMAMIAVRDFLEQKQVKSRLVLQVHDELILEVPENEVELLKEAVPRLMASVATLKVPLIAEVGVAQNWEAAH